MTPKFEGGSVNVDTCFAKKRFMKPNDCDTNAPNLLIIPYFSEISNDIGHKNLKFLVFRIVPIKAWKNNILPKFIFLVIENPNFFQNI